MGKNTIPTDCDGEEIAVGDYVKYDGKTWEVVDYEDSEQKYYDDDYTEHTNLLLTCHSHAKEHHYNHGYAEIR